MTEQPLFITENKHILPTLEKIHPDQAKNMQELCQEMECLIDQTNTNVNQMLKSQQNNILNAFKQVLETMKKDIDKINEKFHQYVAYNEQESQVINAQNKMVYFRQECHSLNEQCKHLKLNVQTLTKTNKFLENELMFTKEALIKQVKKNEKLQQTIQRFKEQLYENQDMKNYNYNLKILTTEPKMLQDYQQQIQASVRRARFDSSHKKNTSFNSITNTDTKSKYILTQQTRAQSLQKSIVAKRSTIFENSILDKSQKQDQIFEYPRIKSLKQDNDNKQ
ncbi:unnamed protein product [Paramecium primaurelia]|uniref:Uncharacterized protein n=1 Tax=Paramecium primaurelia TaxID=5886 RepID=A0A8S1KMD6_PARPR|nr:unnamed protein product [Paramecium primaurelia]